MEVLDMEEKDKRQAARDFLDSLDEKVNSGLEMTQEEGTAYLMALIDLLSHPQPEDMPENTEFK